MPRKEQLRSGFIWQPTVKSRIGSIMNALANRCFHALAVCSLLLAAIAAQAGSLTASKHDLSLNGVNMCAFCHMPTSQGGTIEVPLWDKSAKLENFNPYNSEAASKGVCLARPGGVSMVCLDCHDGSNAKAVFSEPKAGDLGASHTVNDEKCFVCHKVIPNVPYKAPEKLLAVGGAHQMNHPIFRSYPTAVENFNSPPDADKGWSDVRFFNGKVECPSCHAVHDPTNKPFLRISNEGSALCVRCHNK